MKQFIRLLIFMVWLPLYSASQITTPIIKAGFGVDADLRARFFDGVLQTSDDWFLLAGTPGTSINGEFVIDTTGAAAILAGYLTDISPWPRRDRKSTRLNSSHSQISYAVFCLKKK